MAYIGVSHTQRIPFHLLGSDGGLVFRRRLKSASLKAYMHHQTATAICLQLYAGPVMLMMMMVLTRMTTHRANVNIIECLSGCSFDALLQYRQYMETIADIKH